MSINLMIQTNVNLVSIAIQARAFAFVQGFLPNVAQKSNIINDLERPNFASFVAFAYSAGLHLDNDECVSHGWVFNRPEKVQYILNMLFHNFSYSLTGQAE